MTSLRVVVIILTLSLLLVQCSSKKKKEKSNSTKLFKKLANQLCANDTDLVEEALKCVEVFGTGLRFVAGMVQKISTKVTGVDPGPITRENFVVYCENRKEADKLLGKELHKIKQEFIDGDDGIKTTILTNFGAPADMIELMLKNPEAFQALYDTLSKNTQKCLKNNGKIPK